MLFRLYIGSNNETKKLEDKKAIDIIAKRFQGFTVSRGIGYWEGAEENNLIVDIEGDRKQVEDTAKVLKIELVQQAIGLAEVGKMRFIS